jgi:hypothetical protein
MKQLTAILLVLASTAAYGGSIRYELPELLGEHSYDGGLSLFNALQHIDTPFGFYDIDEARLVIVGHVVPGLARGDGIIREATSFMLLPSVGATPSFARSITLTTEPTPESFRQESIYPNPFVPETTPLPNPDGYPPVSLYVSLLVTPAFGTQYPPLIAPQVDLLSNGIIVDQPIVANIDQAYIVLSGANIVPEPGSIAILGGLILLWGAKHRIARYAW